MMFSNLYTEGIMTILPLGIGDKETKKLYKETKKIRDEISKTYNNLTVKLVFSYNQYFIRESTFFVFIFLTQKNKQLCTKISFLI